MYNIEKTMNNIFIRLFSSIIKEDYKVTSKDESDLVTFFISIPYKTNNHR